MVSLTLRLSALAGVVALAAAPAVTAQDADAPYTCTLTLSGVSGGTLIEGVIESRSVIEGQYSLAIRSRSLGGQISVRQGGDFRATPSAPAQLGGTRLPGRPAQQDVDLEIEVDGRVQRCGTNSL